MNEYMPTTQQVEDGFTHEPEYEYHNPVGYGSHVQANRRAFERWLAEVERAAAEKAWTEGELAGTRNQRDFEQCRQGRLTEEGYRDRAAKRPNPYRRNEGGGNAESSR